MRLFLDKYLPLRMADDGTEGLGIISLDQNLSDIEKPPEVPPGLYTAEVQDVQVNTSGKGNNYFAIRFVIPVNELPPDYAEHYEDGAVLFWNRQIVPKPNDRRALFNLRKLVTALGLSENVTEIDPNDWMGRTARLRVVHGKWQGENRAEIKSIEPAEQAARAPRQAAEAPKKVARGRR